MALLSATFRVILSSSTILGAGVFFVSTVRAEGLDYSKCYTSSGTKAATNANGKIAVGVMCKNAQDVLVGHEFSIKDTTQAKAALSGIKLVYSGGVPNGAELQATGASNARYSFTVKVACCPRG